MTLSQLKILPFASSKSLLRINFSQQFSVPYIHITGISKTCLIFSYFPAVFEKSVAPRIIVQSHPIRMLDSYRSTDN